MKFKNKPKQEFTLFEDDSILVELINQFNVIQQKFSYGEFDFAPHEAGYIRAFKEMYGVEFTVEEMIELREFMIDDADTWLMNRIEEDKAKGMTNVNLEGLL